MKLVLVRVMCLRAATEINSNLTVRQKQRFVGVDTLDDAKVRRRPER